MPTYEYGCDCGALVELHRPMAARNEPVACPDCGRDAVLVISRSSFELKGRGWAADGYEKKPIGAD